MARGSCEAGVTTPKPLIPVDGRPMFRHALDDLDSVGAPQNHSFILREEQDRVHNLGQLIKKELPSANIVTTNEAPKGPLVDAYRARPLIGDVDWRQRRHFYDVLRHAYYKCRILQYY